MCARERLFASANVTTASLPQLPSVAPADANPVTTLCAYCRRYAWIVFGTDPWPIRGQSHVPRLIVSSQISVYRSGAAGYSSGIDDCEGWTGRTRVRSVAGPFWRTSDAACWLNRCPGDGPGSVWADAGSLSFGEWGTVTWVTRGTAGFKVDILDQLREAMRRSRRMVPKCYLYFVEMHSTVTQLLTRKQQKTKMSWTQPDYNVSTSEGKNLAREAPYTVVGY